MGMSNSVVFIQRQTARKGGTERGARVRQRGIKTEIAREREKGKEIAYLVERARAITPDASGAAAEVPPCLYVQLLLISVVT